MTREHATPGFVRVITGVFHPLLARGLAATLSDDGQVRVLARDLSEAAFEDSVRRHTPQAAIVSDGTDHALLRRLASHQPPVGVVVLATDPTRLLGSTLLAIGASCVAHNAPADELLSALKLTAAGERLFVAQGSSVRRHSGIDRLTRREREVYEHLARGTTYAEISLKLTIGYETVRTHAGRVCDKLGVANRYELVGPILPADSVRDQPT